MNTIVALNRCLWMPLCRAYARLICGNAPADTVFCRFAAFSFRVFHGYWPRFHNPTSFEEKVCARMLFDRNPLWTTFCDKWMSRDYVAKRGCAEHLVPVLWHGADPADIPFDALPSRMVIKATHGCGYNIILNGKSQCDRAAAQSRLQRWLLENFCTDKYIGAEWGYRNVRPVIIVEQFIGEPDKVPVDYKFYCFSGRAEYVLLSFDRFGSHAKEIVDREFMPTGIRRGHEQYRGEISPPPNLDAMLRVAETLAHGLDMIRVDLYNVNGRIFFGEMTCYPGGGMIPFEPRSEDFAWGAKWQLAPFVQPKTDGTQSS